MSTPIDRRSFVCAAALVATLPPLSRVPQFNSCRGNGSCYSTLSSTAMTHSGLAWRAPCKSTPACSIWGRVTMLLARAGRESFPKLNDTIDAFLAEALSQAVEVELINHAVGEHAFDIRNDDARTREIVWRTIEFLRTRTACNKAALRSSTGIPS